MGSIACHFCGEWAHMKEACSGIEGLTADAAEDIVEFKCPPCIKKSEREEASKKLLACIPEGMPQSCFDPSTVLFTEQLKMDPIPSTPQHEQSPAPTSNTITLRPVAFADLSTRKKSKSRASTIHALLQLLLLPHAGDENASLASEKCERKLDNRTSSPALEYVVDTLEAVARHLVERDPDNPHARCLQAKRGPNLAAVKAGLKGALMGQ